MRMNISAWSIRNPIPALVLFGVLMIVGYISFRALPITKFPNIDIPIVQVTVTQSGAAPAELETQVTRKIEDAISGINGVKHVTSSITDGTSLTTTEFRLEINVDRAINDVKDAIARVRADLPRTADEPIVQRLEIEGAAIMTYGVSGQTKSIEQLSWFIDDVVIRKLQTAKGVASVSRVGGIDREIRIALDPDRLASLGIAAVDVNRQVRATNTKLAGGRGEISGQEQAIRTIASARTVEDLADTFIWLSGGRKVRLGDLGEVTDSATEPRTFARLDGQPVVAFGVFRAKGSSDASVAIEVAKKIADLENSAPEFQFRIIDNSVNYTVGDRKSVV